MDPLLHTELVTRERPHRACEVCGARPATITVSRWYTTARGSEPSASRYFCANHAGAAQAMLTQLQWWREDALPELPVPEWSTIPSVRRITDSLQRDQWWEITKG
jgi:hypothetical protein